MPRIAGVDLPANKHIWISLTYIYGIGRTSSLEILKMANIPPDTLAKNLTEEQINRINSIIEAKYTVEGVLKRQFQENIQRLIRINCYRGIRHKSGLPVRGQRTRSNARTRKGPKKTVAGRKKPPAPK
jgi:small subunit ribosomal protein S13